MHGLRRYEYSVIGNETYLYCLLGDAAVVFLGFVLHIVSAARAELAYSAFRTDMRRAGGCKRRAHYGDDCPSTL